MCVLNSAADVLFADSFVLGVSPSGREDEREDEREEASVVVCLTDVFYALKWIRVLQNHFCYYLLEKMLT